jgi:hypothetical protein
VPNQYQLEEVIDDQGFASVLNEEFILQIDEDIFKVNMIDGYVYVMDQNNQQYLPQLEDSQLEPNAIYRYRMGLPILDILDAGNLGTDPCSIDPYYCSISTAPSTPPNCFSCGTPPVSLCDRGQSFENGVCNGCAGTNHEKEQDDSHETTVFGKYTNGVVEYNVVRFDSKIAYQPLGIWFSMVSKLKNRLIGTTSDPEYSEKKRSGGFTTTPNHDISYKILNRSTYNFRKRCKNRDVGSEDEGNGFSDSEIKTYRFYNGTRCLKDYCVTSEFGYFNTLKSGTGTNYNGDRWVLNLKSY